MFLAIDNHTDNARRRLAAAARGERGMSLIEILVVLAIIGLIAGGFFVAVLPRLGGAKVSTAKNEVIMIEGQSEMYMIEKSGACPKSMADLKAAGIAKKVKKDPWGGEYKITCPGEHNSVDVSSAGEDKKFGSEDDINSWEGDGGEAPAEDE
jgi:general secretion pathway protein G